MEIVYACSSDIANRKEGDYKKKFNDTETAENNDKDLNVMFTRTNIKKL